MKLFPSIRLLLAISLFTCLNICAGELPVNLQRMLQGTDGQFLLVNRTENWKAEETAIVICDMWDRHWCPSATANVMELAPAMDRMLDSARAKGITVIHAGLLQGLPAEEKDGEIQGQAEERNRIFR